MGNDGDGVEIRPKSIRLFFVWNGQRCRETLTLEGKPLAPTPPNVAHAHRVARKIRKALELGVFAIADYFPDSPRAGARSKDAATFGDWDWILGVNLGGVVNTLVTFLPGMKAHGQGGHIVNVASMSAFVTGPNTGIYAASKFAVRGLTESLRLSLAPHKIGVSLVCPGLTRSKIHEASLRRAPGWGASAVTADAASLQKLERVHAAGMDAGEVASKVVAAVIRNQFYVFTHSEFKDEVRVLHDEVDAAFPADTSDPARMEFETMRRKVLADARRALEEL